MPVLLSNTHHAGCGRGHVWHRIGIGISYNHPYCTAFGKTLPIPEIHSRIRRISSIDALVGAFSEIVFITDASGQTIPGPKGSHGKVASALGGR